MQRQVWSKFVGLTAVSLLVSLTVPVLAQNPPASTYKSGYWQPIARVNPQSSVIVTLINQTGKPLKYNYLDGTGESNLPVGANRQLKNVPLPSNIAIYDPSPQAASTKSGGLTYQTSTTGNDIKVIITPTQDAGYQVVNISKSGAIYVY